ncbi:hypothetical protein FRC11_014846, partial [Ceratobasidium sp. 423]
AQQQAKIDAKITDAKEIKPPFQPGKDIEDELEQEDSDNHEVSSTNMAGVQGGSWQLCFAWFQLGQHRKLPPQMSVDLHEGLDSKYLLALKTNVFAWKSPVDIQINNILWWWFPTFFQAVTKCKAEILANVQPPPPTQLVEKWASVYPHLALGYNHATHKHQDCGGVVHGLEFLLLTGDFSGGDLYLQDLNLKAGYFCAFDGKLFTHEVGPWEGIEHMCFIYFVKWNIFEHYGIPTPLEPPSLGEVCIADGD